MNAIFGVRNGTAALTFSEFTDCNSTCLSCGRGPGHPQASPTLPSAGSAWGRRGGRGGQRGQGEGGSTQAEGREHPCHEEPCAGHLGGKTWTPQTLCSRDGEIPRTPGQRQLHTKQKTNDLALSLTKRIKINELTLNQLHQDPCSPFAGR